MRRAGHILGHLSSGLRRGPPMQDSEKLEKLFLSNSLQLSPQNDEIVALVQRYDLIFVVFPTTVTTKQQNRSVGLRV